MSDVEVDDRGNDPDYEPKEDGYETVNIEDFRAGTSVEMQSMPTLTEEGFVQAREIKTLERPVVFKRKKNRRTSLIWTKFTIVDKREEIASCNICHQRLSMKSTSNNLKKHLERKHGFSIKLGVVPKKPKYITPTPRAQVSELAGISDEGITVKVVGENGEEEHFQVIGEQYLSEEIVQGEERQEHDYSTMELTDQETETLRVGKVRSLNETRSSQSRKEVYAPSKNSFLSQMDEKTKRQRMQELQLECLENKKYNMQLEALLMEQQLNLPRSIFTQPLRYADTQTRSTQTDVGGNDTRVYFISDRRGGRPSQQLFAMADMDDY